MTRRFAEETRVPVEQTRSEIEKTLMRYGATGFMFAIEPGRAVVMFTAHERKIRFDLKLPDRQRATVKETNADAKEGRRLWRALLLCIKSRLEAVASDIETFEEAFLSHVVMPDGRTVAEHAIPAISASYKGEKSLPLLPPPKG